MENKRLLIVDDDMTELEIVKDFLEMRGVETVMVASAEEAEAEIAKKKFDLILIDVTLSGDRNGLDLLEDIRKRDKQTKIYIITGWGEEYCKDAYNKGASLYIEKPLNMEKIKSTILKPLGVEG